MELIFHEKQEGSLCAQHCLNALLQGQYFTPFDLAELAQKMDDEERLRMAESGVDTEEYRRFIEQPSGNYDDSGYFSVQVISSALGVLGLEIVPYSSSETRALQAQKDPCQMKAFICNYRDHWLTIRKLGNQWFNLNSLLTGPELISNTYLSMFLAQLQQEGFAIFVVFGNLPYSEADNVLKITPAVQVIKPKRINSSGTKNENTSSNQPYDEEIKKALSASLNEGDEDEQLQKALEMSLDNDAFKENEDSCEEKVLKKTESEEEEEINLQKALRLSLQTEDDIEAPEKDETDELEQATRLSLECCDKSTNSQLDQEELRRKRLNYLESSRINQTSLPSSSKNSLNT